MRAFLAQQCVCVPGEINIMRVKLTEDNDVSETGREGPKLPLEVISDKPSTKMHLLVYVRYRQSFFK